MLTKKHFIEFADFLVEEELKIIPRYNQLKTIPREAVEAQ